MLAGSRIASIRNLRYTSIPFAWIEALLTSALRQFPHPPGSRRGLGGRLRRKRRRSCRSIRIRAACGGEIGDDDDFAADEGLRCISLGDSGQDLAGFVAEVDFETQQLVGFGDALGDFDLGDAELDFGEVVDGDFVAGSSGGRGGGSDDCACGGSGGSAGAPGSFVASSGPRGVAPQVRWADARERPFLCGCRWFRERFPRWRFRCRRRRRFRWWIRRWRRRGRRPASATSRCAARASPQVRRGFGTGSAAPAGGGVFFCSSSFIRVMVSLSARGKRGESSPSLVPGWSPRHCRFLRSALRISPRPSCVQTLAAASGMTGYTRAVMMRMASAAV